MVITVSAAWGMDTHDKKDVLQQTFTFDKETVKKRLLQELGCVHRRKGTAIGCAAWRKKWPSNV